MTHGKKKLKIALTFLDKGGSIGICSLELAKVLAGHTYLTCYIAESNRMLDVFNKLPCQVKTVPIARGYKSLCMSMFKNYEPSGLADMLLNDNPDIVLDTGTLNWIKVVERMLKGKLPIVEVIHDSTPHPGLDYFIYTLQRKLYPSRADAFVSMSNFCYNELKKRYPDKYHIASKHGIILPKDNINIDSVAARRHKQLFFGRIEPYKGMNILLKAYEIAKAQMPELELSIMGSGKITSKELAQIKRLEVNLRNEYLSDSDVDDMLDTHGVMVMPYTSATQSGVAAVALANAMPCIATNVGGLPEQVIDNRNGFVVERNNPEALAKAMIKIAQDKELASYFAKESIKIGAKDYNWEDIGQQLISDLEKFLETKN